MLFNNNGRALAGGNVKAGASLKGNFLSDVDILPDLPVHPTEIRR
jgi:hypothetical protein